MDFDAAAQAHFEWKAKLRKYLAHPDGSLKFATVAADDQCPLGKWIHADGSKHSADRNFEELRKSHASFHQAAAALVKRADSGEKVDAEAVLGAASPFNELSQRVTNLIRKMKLTASAPVAR